MKKWKITVIWMDGVQETWSYYEADGRQLRISDGNARIPLGNNDFVEVPLFNVRKLFKQEVR